MRLGDVLREVDPDAAKEYLEEVSGPVFGILLALTDAARALRPSNCSTRRRMRGPGEQQQCCKSSKDGRSQTYDRQKHGGLRNSESRAFSSELGRADLHSCQTYLTHSAAGRPHRHCEMQMRCR